jgi:hypothetical protein
MFIIKAPHPIYQTSIIMPSPERGNSEALAAEVQILRSINGKQYVYKKDKQGRRIFQWSFILSRYKAIELRNFVKAYYSCAIKIIDHDSNIFIGYLQNNPFELGNGSRAGGFPGDETQRITLEFEERV